MRLVMDDIRLMSFPQDDACFAERLRALVGELRSCTATEADLVAGVRDGLRNDYPKVSIRSRDPIAEYWPEQATWYVYRDGHPTGDERHTSSRDENNGRDAGASRGSSLSK
jgi:hypothetical protein